ncbi:hypothetical protein Tco_1305876, partial [Tanacetum coccineum]
GGVTTAYLQVLILFSQWISSIRGRQQQKLNERIRNSRLTRIKLKLARTTLSIIRAKALSILDMAIKDATQATESGRIMALFVLDALICSGSAYQKEKNVEEGVESVAWQAIVLVLDGLTFRKGGRMNCGHTAYGMVQSDKVPGWSELLLEHAYSDSQGINFRPMPFDDFFYTV